MLKIKDVVDLKELGKFGFVFSKSNHTEVYTISLKTSGNRCYLNVQPISKEIIINADSTYILGLDVLFDLIQAGLVEKVEGE